MPRLLIEDDHPTLVVSDYSVFRRAGFEVALCSGPSVSSGECPLLRGETCCVLEGADAVLHALPESTGVADAIRNSRPELDMVTLNRHGSYPGPCRATSTGTMELDESASLDAQIQAVCHALTHFETTSSIQR